MDSLDKLQLSECSLTCAGVFASGGEDQMIAVWDLERTSDTVPTAVASAPAAEEEKAQDGKKKPTLPPQLIFQHAGHRSQVRGTHIAGINEAPCFPSSRYLLLSCLLTHTSV